MPRPKRFKVAPSAPAPRKQKAVAKPVEPKSQPQKALFDDLYHLSDSEERSSRSLHHVERSNTNEMTAMRNMGASSMNTSSSSIGKKRKADAEIGREADQAGSGIFDNNDLLSSSPEVEVGRRETSMSTPAVEGSRLAIGNFKRRARQPSILGQAAGRGRSSSVESNLAYDNGLTSIGRNNTSSLAMGGFGARPRQISMGDQNVAAETSGNGAQGVNRCMPTVGSALKIGNFKRRAREPSILRTAQKGAQPRVEYDDDDEEDFNPEDESTPLNLTKTRTMATSSTASSSNPRRHKLSDGQVLFSSPTRLPIGDAELLESVPLTDPQNDEAEDAGKIPSPDEDSGPAIEAQTRHITPEPMSETMAPPYSTSSCSVRSCVEMGLPPQCASSRGRRILRAATPPSRRSNSPISSPPSLTHSPNFSAAVTAKAKRNRRPTIPPSAFSTAQLQSLLPRRRRHVHDDPFNIASSDDEVDTSGLASDDDELSHLNVRAPQRRQNNILSRTPAILKKTIKPRTTTKLKQTKAKVVYSSRARATTSDKENEEVDPDNSLAPLPDHHGSEDSQELEKRVGAELKKAARKFKEVDKWELEFENVTASSSSPDAR